MRRESLSDDEVRLLQAFRGLPTERQEHLQRYASGLVIEHASEGRVLAAVSELRDELDRRNRPSPKIARLIAELEATRNDSDRPATH